MFQFQQLDHYCQLGPLDYACHLGHIGIWFNIQLLICWSSIIIPLTDVFNSIPFIYYYTTFSIE